MKKLIAAIIFLSGLFCGGVSTFAETVKVDFSLDTTGKTTDQNTILWQIDKEKTADRYDAISGASINFSTKIATSLKLPEALKKLALFPVSAPEMLKKDAFSVEQNDDGSLDVTFVHRGVAYWISSDKRGRVDAETGFSYAVIGEKTDKGFSIKDEFVKDGEDKSDMKNIDWDKVEFEDDKIAVYSGMKLKRAKAFLSFADDILTVRAVISWVKE